MLFNSNTKIYLAIVFMFLRIRSKEQAFSFWEHWKSRMQLMETCFSIKGVCSLQRIHLNVFCKQTKFLFVNKFLKKSFLFNLRISVFLMCSLFFSLFFSHYFCCEIRWTIFYYWKWARVLFLNSDWFIFISKLFRKWVQF